MNWYDAKTWCENETVRVGREVHLAYVTSEVENDVVYGILENVTVWISANAIMSGK